MTDVDVKRIWRSEWKTFAEVNGNGTHEMALMMTGQLTQRCLHMLPSKWQKLCVRTTGRLAEQQQHCQGMPSHGSELLRKADMNTLCKANLLQDFCSTRH